MTLPVSGAISFNAINVELGVAGTTTANINQATYRTLAGVPGSGTTISLSNFYGKSNRATASITYAASAADVSQNLSALSGYSAGTTDITVTINAGVYLYATTTGGYGLNLSGATAGDTVTIINNGFIMGMGGGGGGANTTQGNQALINATAGGPALNINIGVNPTINNQSGYIGGGGGGGGGYVYTLTPFQSYGGGGGAGGGNGGRSGGVSGGTYRSGGIGLGGGPGSSGSNSPNDNANGAQGGGGGGRIIPGSDTNTSGTTTSGKLGIGGAATGTGGTAGGTGNLIIFGANASFSWTQIGGGGNNNASTSAAGFVQKSTGGTSYYHASGSGGGYGATGSNFNNAGNTYVGSTKGVGAGGGKGVNLNGRTITWTGGAASTSRVYGAIS
jgi:hypothetical protein